MSERAAGKTFKVLLGEDGRDRLVFRIEVGMGNAVESFSVQYECRFDETDTWEKVCRYDSSHAVAHRHIFRPDGSQHREAYTGLSFKDGLALAHQNLRTNWMLYRETYARARPQGEPPP